MVLRQLIKRIVSSPIVSATMAMSPGIFVFILTLGLYNYFGGLDCDIPQLAALSIVWLYIVIVTWTLAWTSFFHQPKHRQQFIFLPLPYLLPTLSVLLTAVCIWEVIVHADSKKNDDDNKSSGGGDHFHHHVTTKPIVQRVHGVADLGKEALDLTVQFIINIFFLIVLAYAMDRGEKVSNQAVIAQVEMEMELQKEEDEDEDQEEEDLEEDKMAEKKKKEFEIPDHQAPFA